jgi:DNA-binding NarL/FixJ family response regulator
MAGLRIVVVDDHPLFRDALSQTLSARFKDAEVAQAATFEELSEMLEKGAPADLVMLDLGMPGVHGFSGLLYLRAQYPELPVMVVSANDDLQTIRNCMDFGAAAFVPKSQPVERIRAALQKVLDGGVWTPPELDLSGIKGAGGESVAARLATLTPQQMRVLMMLGEGLLNKQIAYKLGVSEATVKAHVSAILQKLGVDSRTQAVIAVNKIEAGEWQKLGGS